jgi:hypothetical protein
MGSTFLVLEAARVVRVARTVVVLVDVAAAVVVVALAGTALTRFLGMLSSELFSLSSDDISSLDRLTPRLGLVIGLVVGFGGGAGTGYVAVCAVRARRPFGTWAGAWAGAGAGAIWASCTFLITGAF